MHKVNFEFVYMFKVLSTCMTFSEIPGEILHIEGKWSKGLTGGDHRFNAERVHQLLVPFIRDRCHLCSRMPSVSKAYIPLRHKTIGVGSWRWFDPERHTFASPNAKYTNMWCFGVT